MENIFAVSCGIKHRLTGQSTNAIPQYFLKEDHNIRLVLVSYGWCNKWPQTWRLSTTEMYSLADQETEDPASFQESKNKMLAWLLFQSSRDPLIFCQAPKMENRIGRFEYSTCHMNKALGDLQSEIWLCSFSLICEIPLNCGHFYHIGGTSCIMW